MNLKQAFDLGGKTALITGGGTGLGNAMARALSQCGARVVICGRREEMLKKAASELGPNAAYRVHDVTETDRANSLVESIEKEFGPLDILINNAGQHQKKDSVAVSPGEFADILAVHVKAGFALSQATARSMLSRHTGSIIFISSMTALFGLPSVAAYSAAKSAVTGLVRALAVEWSPSGLRVNAIAPGWIESDMMHAVMKSDPDRERKILNRTPLQRFGEQEDIGWAAAYLCSPAAKFVTGTCLVVDGGVSIGF